MLYPLSYEGASAHLTCQPVQRLTGRANAYQRLLHQHLAGVPSLDSHIRRPAAPQAQTVSTELAIGTVG
jgi:hypothetical protein